MNLLTLSLRLKSPCGTSRHFVARFSRHGSNGGHRTIKLDVRAPAMAWSRKLCIGGKTALGLFYASGMAGTAEPVTGAVLCAAPVTSPAQP
ncbi:hypothetical protein, partial [Bradyrhizobium sp.]|uniref:hypothetical protein n=1 Tax=Bradyrhizobium sp. TaxID=376 RepID=UPI003C7680A5